MTLFPLFYGFEIQARQTGFVLVDRDEFNNWGTLGEKEPFPDRDSAIRYAFACDQFKRGRTSTVRREMQ